MMRSGLRKVRLIRARSEGIFDLGWKATYGCGFSHRWAKKQQGGRVAVAGFMSSRR